MSGDSVRMAVTGSVTTGRSSNSTSIRSRAAAAVSSASATTKATWSPTKRTMSAPGLPVPGPHNTGWSGCCNPYSLTGTSCAVKTATTPRYAWAFETSSWTMRACGRTAKRIFMCNMPGMVRSPGKSALPVTFICAYTRAAGLPMTLNFASSIRFSPNGASPAQQNDNALDSQQDQRDCENPRKRAALDPSGHEHAPIMGAEHRCNSSHPQHHPVELRVGQMRDKRRERGQGDDHAVGCRRNPGRISEHDQRWYP